MDAMASQITGVSIVYSNVCLLKRLFRCRSKKTSKLRVTGLCEGKSPVTGEFPSQRASTRKMFPFDDVIISSEGSDLHSASIMSILCDFSGFLICGSFNTRIKHVSSACFTLTCPIILGHFPDKQSILTEPWEHCLALFAKEKQPDIFRNYLAKLRHERYGYHFVVSRNFERGKVIVVFLSNFTDACSLVSVGNLIS